MILKFLNWKLLWVLAFAAVCFILFEVIKLALYNPDTISVHEKLYQEKRFSKFIFAGELLPYNNKRIKRKLINEINSVTRPSHENVILLRNHRYYFDIIEPILKSHNVPDDFKYLAVVESRLKMKVRSPMGAVGPWQLQAETAQELGLTINNEVDERMNLERSTEAACIYLLRMKALFGDWTSVAIAYNMGPTALYILKKRHHVHATSLHLNSESSVFVYRILAYKMLFEHPKMFRYKLHKSHTGRLPLKVVVRKTIPDIALFAKGQGTDYITLKKYNPWLLGNKLTVSKKKDGRHYVILIPS